jgi:hypothetical protein
MPDDERDALLTPLGREAKLRDLEARVDKVENERLPAVEGRVTDIEGKEAGRDKRWDYVMRAIFTIGTGIVIAVVSGLIASGALHL